jgi:hypothetical protein
VRRGGFRADLKARDAERWIFLCDLERGLYWTSNLELTDLTGFKVINGRSPDRLTDRQREHWQTFGRAPGLKHEYRSTDSEFIHWIVAEADKRGETIADAIVAAFAKGGTYHNPNMDQPLSGEAIATFAKRVWVGYPDFSVELVSMGETGGGLGRLSMGWCVAPTPGRD